MGFSKNIISEFLVKTGRLCCICRKEHKVSVHHIIPKEDGGTDDFDNAIPLCPNCHNEVHIKYSPGMTTRPYSPEELKRHKQETIKYVESREKWDNNNDVKNKDRELILFYAQCLDRPAFRTWFHEEMRFTDFDKAMEDTLIALNTGYWRMRDGTLIDRAKGKICLVNPYWRNEIDQIVNLIEEIRKEFNNAMGLDERLYQYDYRNREMRLERCFRHNSSLGNMFDQKRQRAIEIMNSILKEIGQQPLSGIGN
jgi:hypothetical protein